ncbi:MAG: sulfur carrier protein ThiS [Myxococcota bacterium]
MSVPQANSLGEAANPAENRVEVVVNGDVQKIVDGASMTELLAALDLMGRRVAVAVNREIILRATFSEIHLVEGDRIEILEAVGGG